VAWRTKEHSNLAQKAGPSMGHSAHFSMMFVIMLGVLSGAFGNPLVPYGLRSKCYRVFSKVTQTLSSTAFCKIGPTSEVNVCALNIDDANTRVRAMEIEIRALNQASCNKESQNFCKILGFSQGACPAAPYRCKTPFKNECVEDADCKVPVNVCCATCEEESDAFKCEGFTEKLKDAYCQVVFFCRVLFSPLIDVILSENTQVPCSKTLRWRWHIGSPYVFPHHYNVGCKFGVGIFMN
jgi:hypothetical protein